MKREDRDVRMREAGNGVSSWYKGIENVELNMDEIVWESNVEV